MDFIKTNQDFKKLLENAKLIQNIVDILMTNGVSLRQRTSICKSSLISLFFPLHIYHLHGRVSIVRVGDKCFGNTPNFPVNHVTLYNLHCSFDLSLRRLSSK